MGARFRFELVASGWAECELELDGASASWRASYLNRDTLLDLLDALTAVLQDATDASVTFVEEPGSLVLTFRSIENGRVEVGMRRFTEWPARGQGSPVFEATARLRTLAGAVVSEAQRILRTVGEAGYEEVWEGEFPLAALDRLKVALD